MKRITKALLSILLALAMLPVAGLAVPASAATDNPVIFLGGFGTELYLNEGTPEEIGLPAGALDINEILAALKATLLDALRNPLAAIFTPSHVADALSAFLFNLLGLLACDEDGESIYELSNQNTVRNPYSTIDGRPAYEFNFDWRLDPIATAAKLDEYIQLVKGETGRDKVNLYALSFGTVILCAYLDECGTEDVESVFFNVSAHGGLQMIEDLIQMKFSVSGAGLAAFLAEMLPDYAGLIRTLEKLWVFRLLEWPANLMLKCIKNRFYKQAVIPLLGQMPAAWSFVTDDAVFESAKRSLLSDTAKYAELIRKIDGYHYGIGNRTNEILQDAATEIKVALVSGYGCAPIPLGGTFLYQSDFMIATTDSSGGAICADYGKTLPAGYTQKNQLCGHNHISSDSVIDASACVLPEQTWFVKNHPHQYEYGGAGLYRWFLATDNPTVWTIGAPRPQFS